MTILTCPNIAFESITDPELDEQARRDQEMLDSITANEVGLEQRFTHLLDLYETGGVYRARYDVRKRQLDSQLADLSRIKDEIVARVQQREQAKADMEALEVISAFFRSLNSDPPVEVKKQVLDALDVNVHAVEDGSIRIEGLISDTILYLDPEQG